MRIMTLFISILFFFNSFSMAQDSVFLKNLKTKNSQAQIGAIKQKIEFSIETQRTGEFQEVLDYFLSIKTDVSQNLEFVFKLFNRKLPEALLGAIEKGLEKKCQTTSSACLSAGLKVGKCSTPETCEVFNRLILQGLKYEHLDQVVKNRASVAKVLTHSFKDLKLTTLAFQKAIDFGFYDEAKKIQAREKGLIENNNMLVYYKCMELLLIGKPAESESCFAGLTQDPWTKVNRGFAQYLAKQKVDANTVKEAAAEIAKKGKPGAIMASTVFSSVILGEAPAQASQITERDIGNDYMINFMFIAVNEKFKFIDQAGHERLRKKFIQSYPDHLLTQVLLKKLSPSQAKQTLKLGQNHILTRAIEVGFTK